MTSFWNNLPRPFFALAPMEAVTDVVFRHVIAAAALPDMYFTEFTNAASYCSEAGERSTRGRLAFTPDEQPIVAQIWGSKPEQFEQMSRGLAASGFAGIDINMGCPDKTVVKNGAGSGLICEPKLAAELIAAAKVGGLPVSVKTRLGFSSIDEWHGWLEHLLKQDIANVTIHLRTKKEMSNVPAHFELIPAIKQLRDEIAPQTLLTINGDIRDRAHGEELVKEYGVDGIMIGRGVFHDPFAFAKVPLADKLSETSAAPLAADGGSTGNGREAVSESLVSETGDKERLLALLNLHLDLFDKYSTELELRKFEPLKRFFKIYVRDFPGASDLREQLMQTKSTQQVREILSQI